MIRFAVKPDKVFSELLACAITDIAENYLNFGDPRDQEDWLCAAMPRGARFFTASQAREQLLAIQRAHQDDRLYELTKYHWLLLYECLETFVQGFNEQPVGRLGKTYGIHRIDFSNIIRLFFWDTTFLSDHLAKMSREESRTMLIWPESMGLSAGFRTHPDELTLSACNDGTLKEYRNQKDVRVWSAGDPSYPSIAPQ
ncbi:MAG TPA: hypothetical protein VM842_01280 [Nitrospira sp.]|nr:hypothetical protein [Nitrospira sp.]